MTTTEIINLICEKTKDGPVSQWTDRMAIIAEQVGLDNSEICWQGSPITVAFSIYQEAKRRNKIDKIKEVLK